MNKNEFEEITDRLLAENDKGEKQIIRLLTQKEEHYIVLALIEEITINFDGYKIDLADGSYIKGDYSDIVEIIEVV